MKPARYQPLVTSHLKKNGSGVMSKPNKVQIRSSSAEYLQNIFATGELDEKQCVGISDILPKTARNTSPPSTISTPSSPWYPRRAFVYKVGADRSPRRRLRAGDRAAPRFRRNAPLSQNPKFVFLLTSSFKLLPSSFK
jgi:hypothetical protein